MRFTVNGYWQAWDKLQRMARAHRTSLNDYSAVNDIVSFECSSSSPTKQLVTACSTRVNKYFARNLDQDRFDDYIASPQNGYRAIQVTAFYPASGQSRSPLPERLRR